MRRSIAAYSERDAWRVVSGLAKEIADFSFRSEDSTESPLVEIRGTAERLTEIARAMQIQLERGIHKNPPLLVLGNPGREHPRVAIDYVGPLGFADSLKYRHETRGKRVHAFELPDTRIWCVTLNGRRCFTIENEHHASVWDDIPNT
jgi:hypothetical protein